MFIEERIAAVASEESLAEGGRDKLLIIKKINSASVCAIRRCAMPRTKKERYIERAKGPRVDERDVSAINHSRDLRAAKNEEARVSVRNIRERAGRGC